MNKKLLFGIGFVLLGFELVSFLTSSDEPEPPKEISLKNVAGLQDCQMMAIEADGNKIYVVRCPNSEVNIHWIKDGKKNFTHTSDGNNI